MKEHEVSPEKQYLEYKEEIRHIRQTAREILDRESIIERPLPEKMNSWQKVSRWVFDGLTEVHTFDTRSNPKFALLTRAASKTNVAPVLTISELMNTKKERKDLIVDLSGKNRRTGDIVRVLSLFMADKTDSGRETKVELCSQPIWGLIPYYNFRQFDEGLIIPEVMIPSLDAVSRDLARNPR